MKEVTNAAIKVLSTSDCFSFHCKVDQIVMDVYSSLRLGLINSDEALSMFKRRIATI